MGFLPRPTIGLLELVSDGDNVTYSLQEDRSRSGDKFRPTHLMEKVSEYIATCDAPVALNMIEKNVSGNTEAKRTAVEVLVGEGFADESLGSRSARLIEHVRPYRESEDVVEEDDLAPTSPDLAQKLVSSPSLDLASSPPSIGGEDEVESRPRPTTSPPPYGDDWAADDLERARRFAELYPAPTNSPRMEPSS